MNLPNLRKTVKIRFWSLRSGLGLHLGIIPDMDIQVEREAYHVNTDDGWKWQIKGTRELRRYDSCVDTDQESLDNIGSNLEGVEIIPW